LLYINDNKFYKYSGERTVEKINEFIVDGFLEAPIDDQSIKDRKYGDLKKILQSMQENEEKDKKKEERR